MKGYVALTSDEWCSSLKSFNLQNAVFWRKRLQFKAVEKGEWFFFLNRKPKDGKRYVVGSGKYDGLEVMPADEAWKKYESALGFEDEKSFLTGVRSLFKNLDSNIGCLILRDVHFYKKPVTLEDCGIDFSPYIVSGKKITDEESASIILELLKGEKENG